MKETARRTVVATLVVVAVVALSLALWKLAAGAVAVGVVLMATPLAAVLATLVDVIVRDKDPAEEDVPTVLFAKES